MTDRQVNMAMETWNVKESGYPPVDGGKDGEDDEMEMNAMDNWDPKTSDYYSERNSLEVDDEDVTAAVGTYCKFKFSFKCQCLGNKR